MPSQEIVWTVLPRGLRKSAVGDTLLLSVLVSPRLGAGESSPTFGLEQFGDFADWPKTVRERLRTFTVLLDDGRTFEGRVVAGPQPQLASARWTSLFKGDTTVSSFSFDDLTGASINAPPLSTASDFIKELWQRTAENFPSRLPTPQELAADPVIQHFIGRPNPGTTPGRPPPDEPGPGGRPRPGPPPLDGPGTGPGPGPGPVPATGSDVGIEVELTLELGLLGALSAGAKVVLSGTVSADPAGTAAVGVTGEVAALPVAPSALAGVGRVTAQLVPGQADGIRLTLALDVDVTGGGLVLGLPTRLPLAGEVVLTPVGGTLAVPGRFRVAGAVNVVGAVLPGVPAQLGVVGEVEVATVEVEPGQRPRHLVTGGLRAAAGLLGGLRDLQAQPQPGARSLTPTVPPEMAEEACGKTIAWNRDPDGSPTSLPTKDELEEKLDFHAVVSLLRDHADLMRALNLILDVEVPLPPLTPAPPSFGVQVIPQWEPAAVTVSHSPQTRCVVEGSRLLAESDPARREVVGGVLRLGDQRWFRLEQFDVDGGVRKLVDTVGSLKSAVRIIAEFDGLGLQELFGLPALRTTGISVLYQDRRDRNAALGDMLHSLAALGIAFPIWNGKAFNDQLGQDGADGQPNLVGPLFAEDLLAGCRIDVFEGGANAWRSLCRRQVTFDFLDAPAPALGTAPPPPLTQLREGVVEVAATGTDTQLSTSAALTTWEGWSLSAPKPGLVLRPDFVPPPPGAEPPPEMIATPNDPPTRLRVRITSAVENGTLPRLRFGERYRLRARSVDLAGNSLPFQPQDLAHAPDATEEIVYSRFEPVPSPVVVLRKPPLPGESAERLVIRSVPPNASTESCERHLAPQKVPQFTAELYGRFDGPDGRPRDDAYGLAKREAWSLEDHPSANVHASAAGSSLLVDVDQLNVEYLPDPAALGVLITGLPGPSPSTLGGLPGGTPEQGINRVSFYDNRAWPDARPFRLKLEGGAPGSALAAPVYDPGSRTLTVTLPPAETAKLEISCYPVARPTEPPDAQALDALGRFGVWRWIEEGQPSNLDALQREAQLGRFWMLSPSRTLHLLHAVKTPVTPPSIFPDTFHADRMAEGQTEALATGTVAVHANSTSNVDISAEWADLVDDPADINTEPKPDPMKDRITSRAHLGQIDVNGLPTVTIDHRLQVGDTKHHVVRFQPTGTTSFREYFDNQVLQPDGSKVSVPASEFTVTGPEVTFSVGSSARPLAPTVLYSVPTFAWQRQDSSQQPEGDVIYRSTRTGRGLRVFLGRPWYSSGDGELLGVLFLSEAVEPETPLGRLVTRWGVDPVWRSGATDPAVTAAMFPGAVVEHGLSVPEFPNGPRLSVAGYAPTFDRERNVWFCDIEIGDPQAPQSVAFSYFPFVRLALARYQPHSITSDVKLSPVVTTDFVQVGPDRDLTVRALPRDERGRLRRLVEVTGTRGEHLGDRPARDVIEVSVLRRIWAGTDLGWENDPEALTHQVSSHAWEVAFPADGDERRLNVREHEDFDLLGGKP